MREIYHCFWVNVSLEKVYSALTDKDGLAGWWTSDLEFHGTLGDVSTFRFNSGAFNKMKTKTIEPGRIEWECLDGHESWIGTQISFELRKDNGRTKVCFSHYGWKEQTEYVGECSFHWACHLVSLQKYCEIGQRIADNEA